MVATPRAASARSIKPSAVITSLGRHHRTGASPDGSAPSTPPGTRSLLRRRSRHRARAAGPERPGRGGPRPRRRARRGAGGVPEGRPLARPDGELPRRVRTFHRRGRGADVPGRGVSARSRCANPGCPHPRQDRWRRLVQAQWRRRVAADQRIDLGADADRAPVSRRRARRAPRGGQPQAHGAARWRTGGARRGGAGDESDGPAVRARAHHRGSHQARCRHAREGLPLLLRHARRGRPHRGRRQALLPCLRQGHRRHLGARRRPRSGGQPRHLGEAFGAAPALRAGAARTGDGRTRAETRLAGGAGAQRQHRLQHRRRGSRPAGPVDWR